MKNKKTKLIIALIVLSIMLLLFIPIVNADNGGNFNPNAYSPSGLTENDTDKAISIVAPIFGAIRIIGIVISIIMVIYLGIRYMIGSVEERAEYKKTMIPMIIGMIFLFATSTIVGIIADIISNF